MSCPKYLGNPKYPSQPGGTLAFLNYLAHDMEQPHVEFAMENIAKLLRQTVRNDIFMLLLGLFCREEAVPSHVLNILGMLKSRLASWGI